MGFINYNNAADFASDESFQAYVDGSSESDRDFWEKWISAHPEKSKDILEAKQLLAVLKFDEELPTLESKEKVRESLEKHLSTFQEPKTRTIAFWTVSRKIAAVLIGFVFLSMGVLFYQNIENSKKNELVAKAKYIERVAEKGAKMTITLGDGSKIKLNSGSKLIFPDHFAKDKREVFLEGEAFFEVARDESRPFLITTGDVVTKVLGTSFNIKSYNSNKVEVAVATGKVSVKEKGAESANEVLLLPSEMATYEKGHKTLEKGSFDAEELLSWKDGVIVFKNADFEEVQERLERWYGVTFIINKKPNYQKEYKGNFTNKSLEDVLEGVSFSLGFKYKIEGKVVEIN